MTGCTSAIISSARRDRSAGYWLDSIASAVIELDNGRESNGEFNPQQAGQPSGKLPSSEMVCSTMAPQISHLNCRTKKGELSDIIITPWGRGRASMARGSHGNSNFEIIVIDSELVKSVSVFLDLLYAGFPDSPRRPASNTGSER